MTAIRNFQVRHLVLVCALALVSPPVHARAQMNQALPTAINQAVGICLDLISGKKPGNRGKFKKAPNGYVRDFSENEAGILAPGLVFNGSGQPRVDISFSSDSVCSISLVRLEGGYARHFAQVRAAFERRGWQYKRQGIAPFSKGERVVSTNGATTTRTSAGDVLTNFALIEWVKEGRALKRKY